MQRKRICHQMKLAMALKLLKQQTKRILRESARNLRKTSSYKNTPIFVIFQNKNDASDPIKMGVGIHKGNLVLGTIGRATRMETTVISDTVNSSARLESLNKVYGTNILISGEIKQSLTSSLKSQCRLIDRTKVKGKSKMLEVYEVLSADITNNYKNKLETKNTLEKVVKDNFLVKKNRKSFIVEQH